MKKVIALSLFGFAAVSAFAGDAVLLDENFDGVQLDAHGAEKDFELTGWETASGGSNAALKPFRFQGYKSGDVITTIVEAGNTSFSDDFKDEAEAKANWRALYTPELDLDGTYKLDFQWQVSPMCRDGKYKFQIYACESGQTWESGTLLFDCLDKDDLRECGVPESQWPDYYIFDGWKWLPTSVSLSSLNGKKVKLAFVYLPLSTSTNILDIDEVKVSLFDAPTSPKAELSTYEYDFGNVYPGSKLYSDIITMSNVGLDGLKITSVDFPAGFSINYGNIAQDDIDLKFNEKLNFQLVYEPSLTSAASGNVVLHTTGGDVTVAVKAVKQAIPEGGAFEGFEGNVFPPAGWTALKWTQSSQGIEGEHSTYANAYYQEENYLMTPRVDASTSPATITFTYMDVYSGESDYGADTEVKLYFSKDGGANWELVDTYDCNGPYDELVQKSYSRTANSDNCYWKWTWELTYYDSETGAEASTYYLDAVVLSKLYGSDSAPQPAAVASPADGATEVFNRGLTLSWVPAQFATGYKLYVGSDAAATNLVDGELLASTVNTYDLPTLGYATKYNWKVVPYNDKGDATGVPTWSFTTIADPTVTEYPYFNGFESFPGTGWNITTNGATTWSDNHLDAYDGEISAYAYARSTGTVAVLETPDFVLPADEPVIATFYWGDDAPRYLQKDATGVVTNKTTESDGISDVTFEIYVGEEWQQLLLLSDKTNPYWIRERVDLSKYAGKTVAFRWVYTVHNYNRAGGAALDNFTLSYAAPEKLSFSQESFDFGKVNANSEVWTDKDFTIFNDGTDVAEIASVTFKNANFKSSLAEGDKVYSGRALPFQLIFDAGETASELDDVMTVTTKSGTKAEFPVKANALPKDVIFFGFEYDENGSLEPANLVLIDQDNTNPVSLGFVDYPHRGDKLAFMVIDYTANDWPNPYPNTGKKSLVTFGLSEGTSKDWAVGPAMTATENSSFEFYGRNYEGKDNVGGGEVFGQGRAFVVVTTDVDNPSDLSAYEEVASYTFPFLDDSAYTLFETDLSKYAGQRVRVGVRLESTEGLAYFLDDLQFNHFDDADYNGVESVAVDAADAAAEYYNLQGVRVVAPASGSVYIVRRAGKVTKEYIR